MQFPQDQDLVKTFSTYTAEEPLAVGPGETRLLNLPVSGEPDQLLTEQSILGAELSFAAREVQRH